MRVGRDMRDPDTVRNSVKPDGGLFFLLVPIHVGEVLPMFSVFTKDGDGVRGHRAGTGFAVVLADKIRQSYSKLAPSHSVHAEVIPVSLAIVAMFVGLPLDGTPEMSVTELL